MSSTTPKSPERAFALQKYLLLHSQHDALQKHLDQITHSIPSTAISSPNRSRVSSISSSPSSISSFPYSSPTSESFPSPSSSPPSTSRYQTHLTTPQRTSSLPRPTPRPTLHKRRSSLPALIDETILDEISEDEMKLKNVNLQIKSTLMDLLNCEGVKGDQKYRLWVQERLMGVEKELRGGRARSANRRGGWERVGRL